MSSAQPSFESQILQLCHSTDRPKLLRLLEKTRRVNNTGQYKQPLLRGIADSSARVALRQQQRPKARLDQGLPFYQQREALSEALVNNQVIILCGETGSGKTTQLPQLCLELGFADHGMIGHTQPRRIAAQSVSARIAEQLHTEIGAAVGYKIRFNDRSNADAYIKLMTDGILLAEIQHDRLLQHYTTIIIDEAHERSLNIDLLLGYLKQLLPQRLDLKLIVTSATIDPQRFSQYFNDAPILNISGRGYPVEMRYRPLLHENQQRDPLQALVEAVEELRQVGLEDILVFFSGEREIREAAEKLSKVFARDYEVLALYSRLNASEQQKIFQAHGKRRIVLATNVAETSITVPGIRYVIDTGFARVSRYSWRARVQRLPIEKISQASANQRSGRCGRLAPGVCIRLYDEEDFAARTEFTEPEILRCNLASVILQMASLQLGNIHKFDFVEAPDSRLINDGYRLLFELGATDGEDRLLKLGREIARLPVDPRLACMLIRAQALGCLQEMLIIASALSIQDPRDSQAENRQAAQEKHQAWQQPGSDFGFWLKLWEAQKQQRAELTRNQFSRWCRKHYLSYPRMREWQDIYSQLRQQLRASKFRFNSTPADEDTLQRCIFCGIPSHIASLDQDRLYQGTRNRQLAIFPASSLAKQTPKWIMAFALIETTRLYAHSVARFNPQWAMQDASHLHQYEYYEPHWQARAGRVAVFRNTRIYGLLIESGKRVNYASIDPVQSREILIQRALVEGDYRTNLEVLNANRELIDHYQHQEEKHRRRDILISDQQLYEFYHQRLPAEAVDAASLEAWIKRQSPAQLEQLRFRPQDLVDQPPGADSSIDFPPYLTLRNQRLKLDYIFEPGNDYDGVTVRIPLLLLNQFQSSDFERLVPGLLRAKIEALIRSLPRMLRKNFIPVPEFAEACLQRLDSGRPLYDELQQALHSMTGVRVEQSDWQEAQLEAHFTMHYLLEDEGQRLAQAHSLEQLQSEYGGRAQQQFHAEVQHHDTLARSGLGEWDFDSLPTTLAINKGRQQVNAYPALVDYQDSVSIELFETCEDANFYHATGIARLIYLTLTPTIKYLKKNLPLLEQSALLYSGMGSKAELLEDLLIASIFSSFLQQELPVNQAGFNACLDQHREGFIADANRLAELTQQILALHHEVKIAIGESALPADYREELLEQCAQLVYAGFLRDIPSASLTRLPVYFQALQKRLQNYKPGSAMQQADRETINILWGQYLAFIEQDKSDPELLDKLRWMIEEFRIARFAQPMKTRMPVSQKKIGKLITEINSMQAG